MCNGWNVHNWGGGAGSTSLLLLITLENWSIYYQTKQSGKNLLISFAWDECKLICFVRIVDYDDKDDDDYIIKQSNQQKFYWFAFICFYWFLN